MQSDKILEANMKIYQEEYTTQRNFLRYPADWVVRFHNMYLRPKIASGRILDYGCGSANNAILFIEQGYETYGVDVAEESLSLVGANLESRNLDPDGSCTPSAININRRGAPTAASSRVGIDPIASTPPGVTVGASASMSAAGTR